jgi:NAD(P)-dependent dehydrogenase (short-subunit alcohol dehydrogenase family)
MGGVLKVIVTGGAGFIGSNFVRRTLATRPDVKVTVLDSLTYAGHLSNLEGLDGRFEFVKGNICDKQVVESVVSKADVLVKSMFTLGRWHVPLNPIVELLYCSPIVQASIGPTSKLSAFKYPCHPE